jgi:hypothetical protein
MRMRLAAVAAAFGLVLVSAAAIAQEVPEDQGPAVDSALSPDMHTGLSGRVVLASRCPVPLGADDGTTCPTVPLASALTIRSADGSAEVARVASDPDGQFSVPLEPGQYMVVVQAPGRTNVLAQTLPVTVIADGPTALTIQVRPGARTLP